MKITNDIYRESRDFYLNLLIKSQSRLLDLLKDEILDLDIRGCDSPNVQERIAVLAERLYTKGVRAVKAAE